MGNRRKNHIGNIEEPKGKPQWGKGECEGIDVKILPGEQPLVSKSGIAWGGN